MKYAVNEIFHSIHGEGLLAGTPMVFVRFQGCNLACRRDGTAGFDCDTEFTGGEEITRTDLVERVLSSSGTHDWVCLTGGEPMLQIDANLVGALHEVGLRVALETNGTRVVPDGWGVDHITVSPKTAEHTIRAMSAHELRYVIPAGKQLPQPRCDALHRFLSPAWDGDDLPVSNLRWCLDLVKRSHGWRLSLQMHKVWRVR